MAAAAVGEAAASGRRAADTKKNILAFCAAPRAQTTRKTRGKFAIHCHWSAFAPRNLLFSYPAQHRILVRFTPLPAKLSHQHLRAKKTPSSPSYLAGTTPTDKKISHHILRCYHSLITLKYISGQKIISQAFSVSCLPHVALSRSLMRYMSDRT